MGVTDPERERDEPVDPQPVEPEQPVEQPVEQPEPEPEPQPDDDGDQQ